MNPSMGVALETHPLMALHVSKSPEDDQLLRAIFQMAGWRLQTVSDFREALQFLHKDTVPAVICEAGLTECDWRALIDAAYDLPSPPRVIVSSRVADDRLGGEVLNRGGFDLLRIPFEQIDVLHVIGHASLSLHAPPRRSARSQAS